MIDSEAAVVAGLVLPHLRRLGFDVDDVELETSFHIKLGRFWYQHRSESAPGEEVQSAKGRLDILCRHGSRNLMVIEVKRNDRALCEDDVTQAVSYARLVHPMAPIAVVTNGSDWLFVETLSREPLADTDVLASSQRQVELAPDLYEEAITRILKFSSPAITGFCREQQLQSQRPVRQGVSGWQPVYAPAVYQAPANFRVELHAWLESPRGYLAVTGPSGMGKTAFSCFVADELAGMGVPALAYRAVDIQGDLIGAVCRDLDFKTGGGSASATEALLRVLGALHGRKLVVILDGLDEVPAEQVNIALSSWERLVPHDADVSLAITCKASRWERLLQVAGAPSQLAVAIDDKSRSRILSLPTPVPHHHFFAVARAYERLFGFPLRIESELQQACRGNLRLLHIIFEVAKATGIRAMAADAVGIYEAHLSLVVKHLGDSRDDGMELIGALGRAVYATGASEIDRATLAKHANSGPVQHEVLEHLELAGIVRVRRELVGTYYSFAYDGMRNYLVAFVALQLSLKSPEALQTLLREVENELQPAARGFVPSFVSLRT